MALVHQIISITSDNQASAEVVEAVIKRIIIYHAGWELVSRCSMGLNSLPPISEVTERLQTHYNKLISYKEIGYQQEHKFYFNFYEMIYVPENYLFIWQWLTLFWNSVDYNFEVKKKVLLELIRSPINPHPFYSHTCILYWLLSNQEHRLIACKC